MTTPQITRHDADEATTLAGEHARLMRDVARRTAPVLAVLSARTWPHAELGTLTSFLRAAVLRQISDEEVHLYPHDSSAPPFAELTADHVRLHTLTAQLERLHECPCPPAQLRGKLDELLAVLRRHLADEEKVLAALPAVAGEVPGVGDLTAAHDAWLGDDTPIVIYVDRLPAERASDLCVERLLRLRPGETAELHATDQRVLRAISTWLHAFDAARFGLDEPTRGPDHLLRVTARHADEPAAIGYPG